MQIFAYTAKNEASEVVKGQIEARSESHAAEILRSKHLVLVSLKAHSANGSALFERFHGRISAREVVTFTQQLSTMINAGLPLTDALNVLQIQARPQMSKVLGEILHNVEGGSSLADALSRHPEVFSSIYVALVKAGEAAGKLDAVLERLAETEEKKREFQSKVKGAMVYPIIIFLAMIGVMVVMMIFVVPQLTEIYNDLGADLPIITQILVATSSFMVNFWWLLLAGLVAGVIAFSRWYQSEKGKKIADEYLLKMPLLGNIITQVAMTEFSRTLSLLINAGISILEALLIVGKTSSNVVIRGALKNAGEAVEKGVPLAAALAHGRVFPPVMAQMIAVGEETGKLDEILMKVSAYFETESEHQIKNLTTAMEPLIMIMMGIGVGILVFAVIMPIYNLTEQF